MKSEDLINAYYILQCKTELIYSTGRGDRIRIEGFITGANFPNFLKDLEIYKLDYKVNKLIERKVSILDTSISNSIADFNDLPF